MSILKIIYDWPPPWDGLAPHPYELTMAQAKLGHELYILAGRWPRQGDLDLPNNVHQIHLLNNPRLPFRAPLTGTMLVTVAPILLIRYLAFRRRTAVDIVHAHGHFGLWIYVYRSILGKVFKRAKELRAPLVTHFHNTVEGRWQAQLAKQEPISPLAKYLDWPLARWADKLAVKASAALIFVSEETKQQAIKYYAADPQKCYVVESGVNVETFKPVGPEEREKTRTDLGIEPQDRVLLSHGILSERKNIHVLVEALPHLPEQYKLFLVGPFRDTAYQDKINDIIADKKLKNRVIMSGYTPYPYMPIAHQAADLFVLPSSYEGTPKVVMQSLACGVPALVSGFKLSEELHGLQYFTDISAEGIARQVQEFFQGSLSVDVPKVRGIYSWDMRARMVEQVYAKLKSGF